MAVFYVDKIYNIIQFVSYKPVEKTDINAQMLTIFKFVDIYRGSITQKKTKEIASYYV